MNAFTKEALKPMPKIIENLAEKLSEEAKAQVLEVGYEAMNIRAVAKNCGVGLGTVYNYYPSKDALIASFMLKDWTACLNRVRKKAARGDLDAVLSSLYKELSGFIKRYDKLFSTASAALPAAPPKYHAMLRAQIADIISHFSPDEFTSLFASEAIITWTLEKTPKQKLLALLHKLF